MAFLRKASPLPEPQPAPAELPDCNLAAAHPPLNELLNRIQELNRRHAAVTEELVALDPAYRQAINGPKVHRPREGVASLLAGLVTGDRGPPSGAAVIERRHALDSEQEDIRLALEELRRNVPELETEASRIVVARVAPEHRARVATLIRAMIDAAGAYTDYLKLADRMNAEGVKWSHLGAGHYHAFSDPRQSDSRFRRWLDEMVRYGHFDREEVPEKWRK